MTSEALTVKSSAGSFFNPRKEPADCRTTGFPLLVPSNFAVSASLVTEDDFELSGEFLEVWARAGERAAGFLLGAAVVAAAWVICTSFT